MSTIRVLGGTGFLGSRIVTALGRLPGARVESASRHGAVRVDVTRKETFAALDDSDLVIDVSDATRTPPDELIGHCLERGITVVETTSDSRCVERLHQRFRSANKGALVLGGGIFTGVSNLLARRAAEDVGRAERVRVAISSSPFSGAGAGTIELMIEAMRTATITFQRGKRAESERMLPGPAVDFGAATRPTLVAPFAEAYMLHESTGADTVDVLFSPRPAMLVPSFRWMPSWVGRTSVGRALLRGYFTVLRRWLLSGVASGVELYARAEGAGAVRERRVFAPDGMMAAAWAVAAMAERVLEKRPNDGACFIDDLCELDATIARANALAGHESLRTVDTPAR
ncbi:MAG: hypothetical protein JNK05_05855 [Myxococcales bacterium]|nr:hypothetical protein [Myxococcales bacterium]